MSEVTEAPGAENEIAIMKGKKQVAVLLLFRQMLCEGSASDGTGNWLVCFDFCLHKRCSGATLL